MSTAGGTRPLWAPNAQELFYLSPAGAIMGVGVAARSPSWVATTPTMRVKEGYYVGGGADQTAAARKVIVVQHWTEELKRLVPTR